MFFREKCKEKNDKGIIMPNGEEKLDWDRKYRISQSSVKEALIEKKEKANLFNSVGIDLIPPKPVKTERSMFWLWVK